MCRPRTLKRFSLNSETVWITAVVWITCFAGTSVLGAANEVGPATVVEATVYLDGAEVVREVTAQVPRGASTVTVVQFPDSVDPEDVRVSSGHPEVKISSMTIATRSLADEDEIEVLDEQLAELGDRIFELDQVGEDRSAMRSFLLEAVETKTREGTEEDPADELDADSIRAIYGLMESSFDDLLANQLSRRKERREIEARIAELKAAKADAKKKEAVRVAQVQVQAETAGEVAIRFRYLVSEAQWAPRYRASLDDDGNVELVAEAAVRQWTADDWVDARLRLTTVSPSQRLRPPYLGTWTILAVEITPSKATGAKIPAGRDPWAVMQNVPGVLTDRVNVGGNESGQQSVYTGPGTRSEDTDTAVSQSLETISTRYSVTYDVIGRPSLPGDGQTRQVGLWRERLPATVSYRVKPSLATEAYLEAAVLVPGGVPLLKGPIRIYAGASWLGDAQLSEAPPGANLILPFGVDKRLQVERRTLDAPSVRSARKHRVIARAFRTKITNLADEPVKLVLEDRHPVSDDERVRVTTLDERTTAGASASGTRRGVLLWKLEIPPGETMEVDFAYSVQYPSELRLRGIE